MTIMKKLFAVLIAVSCLLSIISCGHTPGGNTNDIPVSEGGVSFSEFVKAAAATASPKTSVITARLESSYGTLKSVLSIEYATDGSSVMVYNGQRYGSIALGEAYIVDEDPITVTCDASGNYSDGGELAGNVVASGAFGLNLVEGKLRDAKIEGDILYATVFSADTADVLGINLGATTSIAVAIKDGKINSVSVSYRDGADKVSVECAYGY